jgi:hypothetical protein
MQRGYRVQRQSPEQAIAQVTRRLVQRGLAVLGVPHQQGEEHLGMGVVWRHLDGDDRQHADARILQLADQLGQVALDLVGDPKTPVRNGLLVAHGRSGGGPFKREPRRLLEGGAGV